MNKNMTRGGELRIIGSTLFYTVRLTHEPVLFGNLHRKGVTGQRQQKWPPKLRLYLCKVGSMHQPEDHGGLEISQLFCIRR